jgi:hypothetical protein
MLSLAELMEKAKREGIIPEEVMVSDADIPRIKGGVPVTIRIKKTKQPKEGYINPLNFSVINLGEGIEMLNPGENIQPNLIGIVVDYLTRYMSGTSLSESFNISLKGARCIHKIEKANELLSNIKGLDDLSITNAVKLTGFDVCYRSKISYYKPIEDLNPDEPTIENVRKMVERACNFLDKFGPKVLDGFTFKGGYTNIVNAGDGDFITADTLWDFKVSKYPITKEHTLQLLMYWRMGLHSIHQQFQDIKYLGVYNPRMNKIYKIATSDISQDVISEVEINVIGYPPLTQ